MPSSQEPSASVIAAAVELLGRESGQAVLRTRGTSMAPTFLDGAAVEVAFGPGFRFGDVLLFRQNDYLVVHRCLGRTRTRAGIPCLRARGDGISRLDPPVGEAAVLGRVIAVERPDGWRSLRGGLARSYAVLAALHDLAWAAIVHLVGRWAGSDWRDRAVRADRAFLRFADGIAFRPAHRRIPRPEGIPERDLPDPADILNDPSRSTSC